MNKRFVRILGIIFLPVSVLLINACGPEGMTEQDVVLDENTDNIFGYAGLYGHQWSEYGKCNDALDNNGNGLVDSVDPDCHINPGPLRDLSILPFPFGHNYFPDVRLDIPGGPGYLGSFRDPAMLTRWSRFLIENNYLNGQLDFLGVGVNPEVVPIPMPLPERLNQGTFHQGNNNNVSARALHVFDMYHPNAAGPAVVDQVAAAAKAPSADPKDKTAVSARAALRVNVPNAGNYGASTRYVPQVYTKTSNRSGAMYRAGGPNSGFGGSQGADKAARTGNED